jgi:hypothetical protein
MFILVSVIITDSYDYNKENMFVSSRFVCDHHQIPRVFQEIVMYLINISLLLIDCRLLRILVSKFEFIFFIFLVVFPINQYLSVQYVTMCRFNHPFSLVLVHTVTSEALHVKTNSFPRIPVFLSYIDSLLSHSYGRNLFSRRRFSSFSHRRLLVRYRGKNCEPNINLATISMKRIANC